MRLIEKRRERERGGGEGGGKADLADINTRGWTMDAPVAALPGA